MPFRGNLKDREFDKFKQTPSSETAVRVTTDPDSPLAIYEVLPSGIQITRLFSEALSVASNVETTILTYAVPSNKKFHIKKIRFDGTNIAEYIVKLNSLIFDKFWSNHSSGLFVESDYAGLVLNQSSVLTLSVKHNRPFLGDFNAKIIGELRDV